MRLASFSEASAASVALVLAACSSSRELQQPVGMTHVPTPPPSPTVEPIGTQPEQVEPPDARVPPVTPPPRVPPVPPPGAKFVYRLCDLPDTAFEAPHFATNDVWLNRRGRQLLDQVANCMLQGELVGHSVIALGYADPRGSKEYNLKLAMLRARTVRNYLINRGVHPARVSVGSRGEHYARGRGPETWRLDRRVELELDTGASVGSLY